VFENRVYSLLNEVKSENLEINFIDFFPFSNQLVVLIDLSEELSLYHKLVGGVFIHKFIQLGTAPSIFWGMCKAFAENLEPKVRILNLFIFLCSAEPVLQIYEFVFYINLSVIRLFLYSYCPNQFLSVSE